MKEVELTEGYFGGTLDDLRRDELRRYLSAGGEFSGEFIVQAAMHQALLARGRKQGASGKIVESVKRTLKSEAPETLLKKTQGVLIKMGVSKPKTVILPKIPSTLRPKMISTVENIKRAEPMAPVHSRFSWGWLGMLAILVSILVFLALQWEILFPSNQIDEGALGKIRQASSGVMVLRMKQYFKAQRGLKLLHEDSLISREGEFVEFQCLSGDVVLRLLGHSRLDLYQQAGGRELRLLKGDLQGEVGSLGNDQIVKVETPVVSFQPRNARFTLSVLPGTTKLNVIEGKIELMRSSDQQKISVTAGNHLVIAQDNLHSLDVTSDSDVTPPHPLEWHLVDLHAKGEMNNDQKLSNGDMVEWSRFSSGEMTLSVLSDSKAMSGVIFKIEGPRDYSLEPGEALNIRQDDQAPFDLTEDANGSPHGWKPEVGRHLLMAIPLTAEGQEGEPQVLEFTVVK